MCRQTNWLRQSSEPTAFFVALSMKCSNCCQRMFFKCLLCQSRTRKYIYIDKTMHFSFSTKKIYDSWDCSNEVNRIDLYDVNSVFANGFPKKKKKNGIAKEKKNLMTNEWICIFEANLSHIRNANDWYIVKWNVLTLTWPLTQIEMLNETTNQVEMPKIVETKNDNTNLMVALCHALSPI